MYSHMREEDKGVRCRDVAFMLRGAAGGNGVMHSMEWLVFNG